MMGVCCDGGSISAEGHCCAATAQRARIAAAAAAAAAAAVDVWWCAGATCEGCTSSYYNQKAVLNMSK